MTSAYLLRECRTEIEARSNVIRLHPIVPPPHPPVAEPVAEPLLRACATELWRHRWLLLVTMFAVYALAFYVGAMMSEPVPVAQYVEPGSLTRYESNLFRAGFVEVAERPRWTEIRM